MTAEALGGADVHCRNFGGCGLLCNNDEHALQLARVCVANLNRKKTISLMFGCAVSDRNYDIEELYGIVTC